MSVTAGWRDLAIPLEGLDAARLLAEWAWLVPDALRPIMMSQFGDWFLSNSIGEVFFLDLVRGTLTQVAGSTSDFDRLLEDTAKLEEWFMPSLLARLDAAGCAIRSGQCFGYKLPPVLNGALEPDNIEPTDHLVHQALLSQMHRDVKALPVGTAIRRFIPE